MKKMGTAIITGASRGIGAAVAEALAEEGFALALVCRKQKQQMDRQAERISRTYGVEIHTYQVDVKNIRMVEEMIRDVESRSEKISVLVNNAGIAHYGLLSDMEENEWDDVVNTNLKACFNMSKYVVPIMVRQQYGHIINISSMWGTYGASCEVAYSASKGGMNAFTKALAKELAPSGIMVNAISCGVIDTEMNGHLTEEEREVLRGEIPADRFGTPEDVANTVLGLLKMTYVTGQIIGCDGGF